MLKTLTASPLLWKRLRGLVELQAVSIPDSLVGRHLAPLKVGAVVTVGIHGLALNGFLTFTGLLALGVAMEFHALPVRVSDHFCAGRGWFVAVTAVHKLVHSQQAKLFERSQALRHCVRLPLKALLGCQPALKCLACHADLLLDCIFFIVVHCPHENDTH